MLAAILKKELLLVTRDIHALGVLFIMPMAFILIMSLSLKNTMEQETSSKPEIGLWAEDGSHQLKEKLKIMEGFQVISFQKKEVVKEYAKSDEISAAVLIKNNTTPNEQQKLVVYYSPSASPQLRQLIVASISQVLTEEILENLLAKIPKTEKLKYTSDAKISELISVHELFEREGEEKKPTSVQQSVPAWLIFSMFFVVIPIATTFLIEKQQGTLQRLKTYPIHGSFLLIGKLVPYLGINLIQTLLMFLVGIYIVPLLGGDALQLPENHWLLIPMSMAISVTAISFALLVATLVKTTEQATTIGGISNLLLAAIGGIMVPTFIMPDFMQIAAKFSPMNWGMEGYLDILLRQGTLEDILPELVKLLLLAIGLFSLALFFYGRRTAI